VSQILSAPHVIEFPYTRSTGPVIGRFLGGLRDRRILGIRDAGDRVLVPPQEYDPQTSATLGEDRLVEVADEGVVTTWSWNPVPRDGQPLDRPFAWALVRLEGADTPMLHAVDVAGPEAMRTSMRVRARWASEREGRIQDLACFEPTNPAPGGSREDGT
jgi:uncharacterized protein